MHYRARYSLDFDLKIRSGQGCKHNLFSRQDSHDVRIGGIEDDIGAVQDDIRVVQDDIGDVQDGIRYVQDDIVSITF